MSGEVVLFAVLAVLSVGSGIAVVATRRAILSALALVLNFFVLALFYFMLGSQLLGIVQVVVYLGAIMVLFLFCIMLLRLGPEEALEEPGGLKRLVAVVLGLGFLAIVFTQVIRPIRPAEEAPAGLFDALSSVEAVGQGLFTRWAFPFEVTSLLLLVGIVGSILLAKRRV